MFNKLWVEKYRPTKLEDIVISSTNRTILESCLKDKCIPNFFFHGKPGIGKTTLAKIIVKDMLLCQYIYINASDENGIDTVRTKINNFSVTKSIDGNIKVVILDEVDGLTMDAQRALRNTMEEYSDYVRFILTANFSHRVIPAVQSRCQTLDMTPSIDDYMNRCEYILKSEQIKYNKDDLDQLRKYYPDLRKCINEVQKNSTTNTLQMQSNETNESFASAIVKLLGSNAVFKVRKHVIENEHVFGGDYINLLRSIYNNIDSSDIKSLQKKESLITISEYMYRSAFVADQEINFYTCLLCLSKILS